MRLCLHYVALAIIAAGSASGQSDEIITAIKSYDNLSLFSSLISSSPKLFQTALEKSSSNVTLFVPSNEAVNTYLSNSGISDIWSIKYDDVETIFSYHLVPASLKSSDFEAMGTAAIPTFLKKDEMNNRAPGPVIQAMFGEDATGQVVVATPKDSDKKVKRSGKPTVQLIAGLAQDVTMTAIDGEWGTNGVNSFQIVDSVLAPPVVCSKTVRSIDSGELTALDAALNKTKLWNKIDTTPSISCLSPSTDAFEKAGNPQDNSHGDELEDLMFSHYLNHTTYTNELEDGMVFSTMYDTTITVHIKGDDIYFNNAKIIKANVLTSNGVLHVLDSIIKPESSKTSSSDSTSTATSSATSDDSNTANIAYMGNYATISLIASLFMM